MNAHNGRRYQMLTRVRDFGLAHNELFPAVDELSEHATMEATGHGAAREAAHKRWSELIEVQPWFSGVTPPSNVCSLLRGAIARLPIFSATEPVEEYDDPRNQRDPPQDSEGVRHQCSPVSQNEGSRRVIRQVQELLTDTTRWSGANRTIVAPAGVGKRAACRAEFPRNAVVGALAYSVLATRVPDKHRSFFSTMAPV
jgi:hypothetical protein